MSGGRQDSRPTQSSTGSNSGSRRQSFSLAGSLVDGVVPPSPRRASVTPRDAHLGTQLQGIVPLLNNPRDGGAAWFSNPFGEAFPDTPPPLAAGLLPEVSIKQFQRYLKREAVSYQRFLGTHDRRDDQQTTPQGGGLRQAMQQVPHMFFQEGFSLSRPQTWDEVAPSDTEEQRTAALDQLSQHLDVVEGHLLSDISAKRDNFFEAASVLADLRGALSRAYDLVYMLRQRMGSLAGEASVATAQVHRLSTRRDSLASLVSKLAAVDALSSGVAALELMLQSGNYPAALDVLADLQAGLAGDPVRGLACCRRIPEQVAESAVGLDQLLLADFLGVTAITEVSMVAKAVSAALKRARNGDIASTTERALAAFEEVAEAPLESDGGIGASREEVAMLVACLRRTGRLEEALAATRDAAGSEAKLAVREVVDRVLSTMLGTNSASINSGVVADNELRVLPPSEALLLLAAVHAALKICLNHRTRVRSMLGEVLRAQRVPRQEVTVLLATATEAMQAASDAVLSRWSKILTARAAVQARLPLLELREVLAISTAAAQTAEAAGLRPSATLRPAVQQLCRAWLDALHSRSMQQLQGLLQRETWGPAPIPPDVQDIVDSLAERGHSDAPHSRQTAKREAQSALDALPTPVTNGVNGRTKASEAPVERLRIGDEAFCMVAVALQTIALLAEYLHFQAEAPSFSGDVARRVVELLQVFNSRSCQLVLGAGAMAAAGLRSITAKHLAMVAQSVGALAALHPLLRMVLAAPVPYARRSLLSPDFDRLLQDLTVHKAEVHSKLVGIMREVLNSSLSRLPQMADRWAESATQPGAALPPPSAFATSNVKKLNTFSNVLLPLLGPAEMSSIFGRVAQIFAMSLSDAFRRLQPQGPAWRQQATADIHALLAALRALPQGDTPSRAAALSPLSSLVAPHAPFAVPANGPIQGGLPRKGSSDAQLAQNSGQQLHPTPQDSSHSDVRSSQLVESPQEKHETGLVDDGNTSTAAEQKARHPEQHEIVGAHIQQQDREGERNLQPAADSRPIAAAQQQLQQSQQHGETAAYTNEQTQDVSRPAEDGQAAAAAQQQARPPEQPQMESVVNPQQQKQTSKQTAERQHPDVPTQQPTGESAPSHEIAPQHSIVDDPLRQTAVSYEAPNQTSSPVSYSGGRSNTLVNRVEDSGTGNQQEIPLSGSSRPAAPTEHPDTAVRPSDVQQDNHVGPQPTAHDADSERACDVAAAYDEANRQPNGEQTVVEPSNSSQTDVAGLADAEVPDGGAASPVNETANGQTQRTRQPAVQQDAGTGALLTGTSRSASRDPAADKQSNEEALASEPQPHPLTGQHDPQPPRHDADMASSTTPGQQTADASGSASAHAPDEARQSNLSSVTALEPSALRTSGNDSADGVTDLQHPLSITNQSELVVAMPSGASAD